MPHSLFAPPPRLRRISGLRSAFEPNVAVPLLLTKFLGGFCGIAAALLLTGKAERRRKGQRSRILAINLVVEGKTHIEWQLEFFA